MTRIQNNNFTCHGVPFPSQLELKFSSKMPSRSIVSWNYREYKVPHSTDLNPFDQVRARKGFKSAGEIFFQDPQQWLENYLIANKIKNQSQSNLIRDTDNNSESKFSFNFDLSNSRSEWNFILDFLRIVDRPFIPISTYLYLVITAWRRIKGNSVARIIQFTEIRRLNMKLEELHHFNSTSTTIHVEFSVRSIAARSCVISSDSSVIFNK
jgi:hypothetical protein